MRANYHRHRLPFCPLILYSLFTSTRPPRKLPKKGSLTILHAYLALLASFSLNHVSSFNKFVSFVLPSSLPTQYITFYILSLSTECGTYLFLSNPVSIKLNSFYQILSPTSNLFLVQKCKYVTFFLLYGPPPCSLFFTPVCKRLDNLHDQCLQTPPLQ